jgi:hypothetical protein
LIQYKRAYVQGDTYTWLLNRTKLQDQHERLQLFESSGIPVFYAFPQFHTVDELAAQRRRLLLATHWCPPSYINPHGGPRGHHDVHFDRTTRRWWVTSDPVPIRPPLSLDAVRQVFEGSESHSVEELEATLNRILVRHQQAGTANLEVEGDGASFLFGTALVVRTPA